MKLKKLLAQGALILASALFTAEVFAAEADAGKNLYEKHCMGCHGADGKGNPAMTKTFGEKELNITGKETAQKSEDALVKVVVEGAGKMPANKKLTKDEIKAVVHYSRSLAK